MAHATTAVSLSLQNTVASYEQLLETPSQRDGIQKGATFLLQTGFQMAPHKPFLKSLELEMDLRAFGCELIESAGILLKLWVVALYCTLSQTAYTNGCIHLGLK